MPIARRCASGRSDGPSNHPRNRFCVFDCAVSYRIGFVGWCMSGFIEVKTSELTGSALDWSVAKAIGYECGMLPSMDGVFGCNAHSGVQYVIGRLRGASIIEELNARFWRPSTDWAQVGPLLEKHIWALPYRSVSRSHLGKFESCTPARFPFNGETPLIAACRAIVASELGDVVMVPVDLVVIK